MDWGWTTLVSVLAPYIPMASLTHETDGCHWNSTAMTCLPFMCFYVCFRLLSSIWVYHLLISSPRFQISNVPRDEGSCWNVVDVVCFDLWIGHGILFFIFLLMFQHDVGSKLVEMPIHFFVYFLLTIQNATEPPRELNVTLLSHAMTVRLFVLYEF